MKAPLGKHKDKLMDVIILKEPSYVSWLLDQSAAGGLLAMKNEAKSLISKFDNKRYTVMCSGHDCMSSATRLSVYLDNVTPFWWCNHCDPYEKGANPGKLQIFSKYSDALHHVKNYCNGKSTHYKKIIKEMAKAKGLPNRAGDAQAKYFFL
jgi:hypothetical protein